MVEKAHSSSLHLVNEREASALLGLTVFWLQKARSQGRGPVYVRAGGPNGRAIRYRLSDLEAFIAANVVDPMEQIRRGRRS